VLFRSGPNPNECVELIEATCDVVLMGNHDYAAIGTGDIQNFNEYAKISTYWTIDKLIERNVDFLKACPFEYDENDFKLVHASPKSPSNWDYVLSIEDASTQIKSFDQNICFIGHSHVPIIFSKTNYYRDKSYNLDRTKKYIINVGSIGQPRDGDPRACFVVYDSDINKVEYIRLEYDIQKTYNKITEAGLPVFLAERLLKGY